MQIWDLIRKRKCKISLMYSHGSDFDTLTFKEYIPPGVVFVPR